MFVVCIQYQLDLQRQASGVTMNLKDSARALVHLVNILNNDLNFRAKINVQDLKKILICHFEFC